MAVVTFTKSGAKATTPAKLDKAVFGIEVKNHELLKRAYLSHLANGRVNLAKTKKRGQVSGGGRKPYRQKGTGNARFGSSRNPIWRGGGIAFGPTGEESYSVKLNQKSKRQALRQALSLAATTDKIMVVETFTAMEGKTKDLAAFLKKLGTEGQVLAVVSQKAPEKEHAARNIQSLKVVSAGYLNVFDVLNADKIIISRQALDIVHEALGAKNG